MGLTNRKRKSYKQSHYNSNKYKVLKKQKESTGQRKLSKRAWYVQNSHKILRAYREKNSDERKQAEREKYASQPEVKRKLERERYASQPEYKRKLEREKYASDPITKKKKLNMHNRYQKCKSHILLQKRSAYYNSAKATTAAKLIQRAKNNKHSKANAKKSMHVVHSYSLHEPNQLTRGLYAKLLKHTISRDASIRKKLLVGFRASNKYNVGKMKASRLANAISHIAVRKLLSQIFKQRKLCAGEFLKTIMKVQLKILDGVSIQHRLSISSTK